ncbi:hypothetical protein [Sphingobacterium siyangense]|uniref:hypothetical protein n=1 Tax=Sphingobacterium siyangense TaxID=459529 RepID=UPI0019646312|nr:hypothetical protein [Sphingobacterium siyangense]QRY59161.1 hypothetical protein JVX97_06880 [Sphingobacterium siyangense]
MKENGTYHDGLEPTNLPASLRENPFGLPENYFSDLESKIITQVKLIECKEESIFEVPEGYFDSLSEAIMCKVAEDNLKNQVATDGFEIPENYASELSSTILNRILEDKLKETIVSDGFTMPSAYNQTLEDSIFKRLAEQELKKTVPTDGFSVPVGYEETVESTIFARIAEEKLKETVVTAGFDVPQHYFETLSDSIINAVQEPEKDHTPIHQIGRPKKWYARYTVAASFAAMLSIGGYWGYQYQQQNVAPVETVAEEQLSQHLSEIPKQEIINYLAASASGDDMIYMSQYTDEANLPTKGFGSNISKQEIEDYLNYTL